MIEYAVVECGGTYVANHRLYGVNDGGLNIFMTNDVAGEKTSAVIIGIRGHR